MFRALVVAVGLLLALGGCAEPASDEATSDGVSSPVKKEKRQKPRANKPGAAQGPTIKGSGYSYRVPKGWGLFPHEVPGFDPDSMAGNLQDRDDFMDNVNVTHSPAGQITLDQAEAGAMREAEAFGIRDGRVHPRV